MARTRLVPVLTLAALAAFAAGARAGEDPKAPPAEGGAPAAGADPVRESWAEVKAAESELIAARQAKDAEKFKAAQVQMAAAGDKFRAAFAPADWNAYDPVADEEMVASGLMHVISFNVGKGDPKIAIKAADLFLAKFPKSAMAPQVGAHYLPAAHLKNHDLPAAVALWERQAETEQGPVRANALVALGDSRAAKGDYAGAEAAWKKCAEMPVADPRKDHHAGHVKMAQERLDIVGKPAPEIDSKTWLGGEPKPLSAHKGQVVVVDFWATWCGPCRMVMPALDKTYNARKAEGLSVIGVTRYFDYGFLPNSPKDIVSPKEGQGFPRGSIKEPDFVPHVSQFKESSAISYPFVVGTTADFQAYKVGGIPHIVLLDREGKVAFVKVGAGDETLFDIALDRVLKSK